MQVVPPLRVLEVFQPEVERIQIEEGEMLLRSFGGIAAVTKYRTQ